MLNSKSIILVAGLMATASIVSSCRSNKPADPQPRKTGKLTILSDRDLIPPPFKAPVSLQNRTVQNVNAPAPQVPSDEVIAGSDEATFAPVPLTPAPVAPAADDPEFSSPGNAPANEAPIVKSAAKRTYKVQKGDSLSVIAYMYEVPWRDLAAENNMTEKSILKEGKTLVLPAGAAATPRPRPATKKAVVKAPVKDLPANKSTAPVKSSAPKGTIPADGVYEVVKGDNLWTIAHRFGLKSSDIKSWNPNVNFDNLQIGKKIILKGGVTAPAPKAPAEAVPPAAPQPEAPVEPPVAPAVTEPAPAEEAPAVPVAPVVNEIPDGEANAPAVPVAPELPPVPAE